MAAEATKAQLVDQIRDMQRSGLASKQAWADYCDEHLGGFRDPNRHEATKLSKFLAFYHSRAASASASNGDAGKGGAGKRGAGKGSSAKSGGDAGGWEWIEAPAAPAAAWGNKSGYSGAASASASNGDAGKGGAGKGGASKGSSAKSGGGAGGWDGHSRSPWVEAPAAPAAARGGKGGHGAVDGGAGVPSLGDIVTSGQRASLHWKSAWQTYCALHGKGVNDPARHDDAHLTGFIDYVGQAALTSLQSEAGGKCPGTEPRSVPLNGQPSAQGPAARVAAAQPPVKRPPVGSAPVGSAARVGTKAALVDKIKALQRSDPTAKQAWWSHCDDSSNGVKNPDLHDTASLEAFLATYSVA